MRFLKICFVDCDKRCIIAGKNNNIKFVPMSNNNMNLMKKGELLEEYSQDPIQSRILSIRGQQVIMYADLAEHREAYGI